MTALELAVIGHHPSLVELLLHHGADPRASKTLGHNIIELAQTNGDKQIMSLLQHYDELPAPPTDCFDFKSNDSIEPTIINSFYASNNLMLDVSDDFVFKNSPSRPVFKTKAQNSDYLKIDSEIESLLSPSLKSVFLLSPEMCSTPKSHSYNYSCLISPRYLPHSLVFESLGKSPKRGKKRKTTSSVGCSSWLKRFTKRYATKS